MLRAVARWSELQGKPCGEGTSGTHIESSTLEFKDGPFRWPLSLLRPSSEQGPGSGCLCGTSPVAVIGVLLRSGPGI